MALEAALGGAFTKTGGGFALSQFLAASSGAITAGAVGGAGILSAIGQKDVLDAQAEQAEINQSQILAANEIEHLREKRRTRARVGAQEAAIGASGTTLSGSAISLIGDELFSGMLNEAIVLSQGGQAATRQENIRNTKRAQARSSLTGGSIGSVAQGIQVGGAVRKLLV